MEEKISYKSGAVVLWQSSEIFTNSEKWKYAGDR